MIRVHPMKKQLEKASIPICSMQASDPYRLPVRSPGSCCLFFLHGLALVCSVYSANQQQPLSSITCRQLHTACSYGRLHVI
ncbi:hypothetical protein EV2_031556 [Malus domestica]